MASYEPVQLAFNSVEPEGCVSEKAPIIFMHGVTASKEYWDDIPQIVANATKRKVYSIDSRNHGDSEWSDVFDFDCNVCDLLNFMDSINAPKAILIGHSMGGVTGMKAALKQPERVEKLIIEDMNVRKAQQSILDLLLLYLNLAQTAIQQVPPSMDEEAAKKMIGDFVYDGLPPDLQNMTKRRSGDYRILLKRTSNGQYDFKANIAVITRAMKNAFDLMTEYTGVYEGPTSFIYGTLSPFSVEKDESHIKQFFPNAELIGIQDAPHTVHTDCPEEFTKELLKCLSN